MKVVLDNEAKQEKPSTEKAQKMLQQIISNSANVVKDMDQYTEIDRSLHDEGQDSFAALEEAEKNQDMELKGFASDMSKQVNQGQELRSKFKSDLATKKAEIAALAEGRDPDHERSDQDKKDMAAFLSGQS